MITQIATPEIFSFEECLWFLDRGFDECLHQVTGNAVRKAILIGDEPVLFELAGDQHGLSLEILSGKKDQYTQQATTVYVHQWIDLDSDMLSFYKILKSIPSLAYMPEAYHGLRLIGIPDLFESLCWSIMGQQINLPFAYKMKRRLVEYFGRKIVFEGRDYWLFPKPEILMKADPALLREMQFSRQKIDYIISTAKAFQSGDISREILEGIPDFDSRVEKVSALRGIGRWTANYVLMKSIRDPRSMPWGDAGLLNALIRHNIIIDKKDEAGINALFRHFKNNESNLVFYLWRSLAAKPAGIIHDSSRASSTGCQS